MRNELHRATQEQDIGTTLFDDGAATISAPALTFSFVFPVRPARRFLSLPCRAILTGSYIICGGWVERINDDDEVMRCVGGRSRGASSRLARVQKMNGCESLGNEPWIVPARAEASVSPPRPLSFCIVKGHFYLIIYI